MTAPPSGSPELLSVVRKAVRGVIRGTPELADRPELQRRIANRMVGVSLAAANLLAEEARLTDAIEARAAPAEPEAAPLAEGLAAAPTGGASDIHGMSAVNSAAGVLRATRDAIDFPNFVTSLISGVFQSIQNSSIQQLQAFSDLLDAVSGSLDDFSATQITDARAISWAAQRFSAFTIEGQGESAELTLKPDADMPSADELRRALDATAAEVGAVSDGELGETLLPLVRRKLARDRQSMLSTMILMGLQRIVVDDGHIHASMDLRVDARSTAERTRGEQFDSRVETEASGSFGMGAWGASARLAASVGFVKSDEQHTREDIAVQAGLRSSVDLRFHTEPLDTRRMASDRTLDTLRGRALVPEAERAQSLLANDPPRRTERPRFPTPPASGSLVQRGSTVEEARRARERGTGNDAGAPAESNAPAADANAPAADANAPAAGGETAAPQALQRAPENGPAPRVIGTRSNGRGQAPAQRRARPLDREVAT